MRTLSNFNSWASANSAFFVAVGLGAASVILTCYCAASLYLVAGGSLGSFSARTILLLALCCGVAFSLAAGPGRRPLAALCIAFIPVSSALVAGLLLDTSFDGQEYHFQGIIALASGWNHYYEPFRLPTDLTGLQETLWTTHYPRASWLVSAVQVASGIPLESAKGATLALVLASASLSAGTMLRLGLRPSLAIIGGLLAAANPVALDQVFTNMNDGLLASCLLIFIALSVLWVVFRDRLALLCLAPLMAFALNLKFSAVPLLAAFAAAACVLQFVVDRKLLARTFAYLAIFGCVAVLGFGSVPYGQNALKYGHPFYPVMGQSSVDIMKVNTPSAFVGQAGVKSFIISLFAKTDAGYVGQPELKVPFTLTGLEIRASGAPDVRIAGFGPLFSGALALSALAALLLLLKRDWPVISKSSFAFAGFLLLLALVFPQGWWARYVPFLWLVPAFCLVGMSPASRRPVKVIAVLISLALGVDAGLVFATNIWLTFKRDRAAQAQIAALSRQSTPICAYFGAADSRVVHFRAHQIRVKILPEPPAACVAEEVASYGPDRNGGAICSCQAE